MISDQMLLSDVPEIHGRDDAGVSATSSGHAPPATSIATPPRQQARDAVARRGPQPTRRTAPARPAAPRPSWSRSRARRTRPRAPASAPARPPAPRTTAHSAPTTHSTSSASGLLWRETATAIGVSASTAPATNPPARPKRRRDEVVDQRDRGHAHQRLRHEHRSTSSSRTPAPTAPAPTAPSAACPRSSRRRRPAIHTGTRATTRPSSAPRPRSTRSPTRCARAPTGSARPRAPAAPRSSGRGRESRGRAPARAGSAQAVMGRRRHARQRRHGRVRERLGADPENRLGTGAQSSSAQSSSGTGARAGPAGAAR